MNNKRLGNLSKKQRLKLIELVEESSKFKIVKTGKFLFHVVPKGHKVEISASSYIHDGVRHSNIEGLGELGEIGSIRKESVYLEKIQKVEGFIPERYDLSYNHNFFVVLYNQATQE